MLTALSFILRVKQNCNIEMSLNLTSPQVFQTSTVNRRDFNVPKDVRVKSEVSYLLSLFLLLGIPEIPRKGPTVSANSHSPRGPNLSEGGWEESRELFLSVWIWGGHVIYIRPHRPFVWGEGMESDLLTLGWQGSHRTWGFVLHMSCRCVKYTVFFFVFKLDFLLLHGPWIMPFFPCLLPDYNFFSNSHPCIRRKPYKKTYQT